MHAYTYIPSLEQVLERHFPDEDPIEVNEFDGDGFVSVTLQRCDSGSVNCRCPDWAEGCTCSEESDVIRERSALVGELGLVRAAMIKYNWDDDDVCSELELPWYGWCVSKWFYEKMPEYWDR